MVGRTITAQKISCGKMLLSLCKHARKNLRPDFSTKNFHNTPISRGFEEFFDNVKPNEVLTTGRSWTAPELRRKSFDDLHKLWYVLYKERNLLLSSRLKFQRNLTPIPSLEENRYMNVKKSMASIKLVLDERKKIDQILKLQDVQKSS